MPDVTESSSKMNVPPSSFLIVLLLFLGLTVSLGLVSRPQRFTSRAANPTAILSMTPDKTSLNRNDVVTVTLGLNPSGSLPVVGVDFIVDFDSTKFTLTDIQPNTSSGFKTFVPLVTNTNTFNKTQVITAANATSPTGTVKFGSATFDLNTNTVDIPVSTASTNVVKLLFQAKAAAVTGNTNITIRYTASRNSTDSNVVIANSGTTTAPEDVLAQPTALVLNILQPIAPTPTSTPAPTRKPGDANNDGIVDGFDYIVWVTHYKQTVTGPDLGDFNNSGLVDGFDYIIWVTNYKK